MKFISSVKYKRTLKYVEYRRCIDTITQGFSKFCAMFKKDHLIGINLKYEYMRALKILYQRQMQYFFLTAEDVLIKVTYNI